MRLSLAALALGVISGCSPAPAQPAPDAPRLTFPVDCRLGQTCEIQHYFDRDPTAAVADYHCGRRTYDGHDGIDIRLPDMAAQRRGVAVLAAAPGRVARLRDGVPDVSIRASDAPDIKARECGNGVVLDHGNGWETQYCHLAQGSIGVKVGDSVATGQPIARVGLSGLTEFPHLHFAVRRRGTLIDPFAPGKTQACRAEASLWTSPPPYRPAILVNAGFAGGPVSMSDVEGGAIPAASAAAPALVAYARAAGLEAGDEIELHLVAPDGSPLATNRPPPLDRDKAQYILYVGKKRPPQGWTSGTYTGRYRVMRRGEAIIERSFPIQLQNR